MKILSVRITAMPRPMPEGMFDDMPKAIARMESGLEVELFSFYPDEISFRADEFVGLTCEQARQLKFKKDRAYLQSL